MRKYIIFLFFLLCVTTAVSAQSMFPILSTPTPAPGDAAPSYSSFANAAPDDETDYGAQGKVLTYNHVTENDYQKFGEYLENSGFEITESNVNGRIVDLMLNNGRFNIGFSYNADEEVLRLIYEKGVPYQKMEHFPGYKRVTFSDTITINKWAEINMVEFELNKPIDIFYFTGEHPATWIKFHFFNKTDKPIMFISEYWEGSHYVNKNGIGEIKLHYINSDNHYVFEMQEYARTDYKVLNEVNEISALNGDDVVVSFKNDSNGLRNATDGTLAVTFDFVTGDKYVVILRENGTEVK